MKKKASCIMAALLLCGALAGCGSPVQSSADADEPSMFVIVERTQVWNVVYHKDTKVMYAVSGGAYNNGTFTLLVNPDGTPMLWEGPKGDE